MGISYPKHEKGEPSSFHLLLCFSGIRSLNDGTEWNQITMEPAEAFSWKHVN